MDGDYETSFLTDSLILIPYADEKNDTFTFFNHDTSAPIGAWKCNFAPFCEIMTDPPTDRPT